jgi:uncharacterized protein YbjT (DUF2867 family)
VWELPTPGGRDDLARLERLAPPVPAATSFQPIDAAEVADRLAGLVTGPPSGRVPDLGGPQIRTTTDLVRAYLAAAGRRRPVLAVWLPGAVFAGYRSGALVALALLPVALLALVHRIRVRVDPDP